MVNTAESSVKGILKLLIILTAIALILTVVGPYVVVSLSRQPKPETSHR